MITKFSQKRAAEIASISIILFGILVAHFIYPDLPQPLILLFAFVIMILMYPLLKQIWQKRANKAWHYYALLLCYEGIGASIIIFMEPRLNAVSFLSKLLMVVLVTLILTLSLHWIGKLLGKPLVPSQKQEQG